MQVSRVDSVAPVVPGEMFCGCGNAQHGLLAGSLRAGAGVRAEIQERGRAIATTGLNRMLQMEDPAYAS
jgi:hypothetical protein